MIINKNKTNAAKKNSLPFKRNLSVALISSSLLFACGGSSDSGGSVVAPTPMNITGTASKGLILGGVVTAYLINDDGSQGAVVGTATTDATDGTYELTLDDSYDGEALIIEITAVDGSQMKCDLSVCLADPDDAVAITFGEIYPLPTDFELSAVSSGTDSDTISINITPLTNIAAALTLDKVAGGTAPAAAAESSNYQIADLLGLDGDVTELPIVDLTDADAINGATAEALNANLKSAAVVEAALSDSADGTSLEDALDSFVTQYVDSNGVADTEGSGVDTSSVSLEEIAEASKVLAGAMTDLDGVNAEDDNIGDLNAALIAEEDAAAMGSTDANQGDVPDDFGSEGLRAAKEFVEQVSTLNVAAQLDGANTFEDEISLAGDLASGDLDVNAEALALATTAIAEAVDAADAALDSGTPITTYQSGNITVAIGISGGTPTFTVDQDLVLQDSAGVATTSTIDLVAALAFSDEIVDEEVETDTGKTWDIEGEASIDLTLSGSVSTDQTSITINDGSNVIATLTVDEEEEDLFSSTQGDGSTTDTETETAAGLFSVTGVDLSLSVTIAQVTSVEVTDPISFTGDFNIAATLLSIDYDETYEREIIESSNTYTRNTTDNGTEIISIDGLTASLTGMFSNSSNSLEASVAIAGSGIEETCVWDNEWTFTNDNGQGSNTNSNSDECSLTGETASTYGSASINVRFALDIDGIEDDVELVAAIERTGLESGVASIDLTYGGNQLDFAFDTDDIVEVGEGNTTITTTTTATLTNHNGVVLTMTDVETDYVDDSELSDTYITTGVISHEGEEFAVVSEDGIVTFSDGTFVSL
jgi:major membrane immunogen (membrane-anchored lipoprotein)